MNQLSKAEILQVNNLKTEVVEVPEWGGAVTLREFTASDRDAFEAALIRTDEDGKREPDLLHMRAKLCAMCIIDTETGDLMFSLAEVETLGGKSAAAIQRVYRAAQRLNSMGEDAVKEAEKNSATGPSGSSNSASPVT